MRNEKRLNAQEIEDGFAALRSETASDIQVNRAVEELKIRSVRRNRFGRVLWLVPLAVAPTVVVFLLPKSSLAAELSAAVEAQKKSTNWKMQTYVRFPGQSEELKQEDFFLAGKHLIFNPRGGEPWKSGYVRFLMEPTRTSYLTKEFFATDEGRYGPVGVSPERGLEWFMEGQLSNLKVTRNLTWNDRQVDQYTFVKRLTGGAIWDSKALVDRESRVPLLFEETTPQGLRYRNIWRYGTVKEHDVTIEIPKGLPTYDIPKLKDDFLALVKRPGMPISVGHNGIELFGIWADYRGNVIAITKGDAGIPTSDPPLLAIDGLKPRKLSNPPIHNNIQFVGDSWARPDVVEGQPLLVHLARFAGRVPDQIRVTMPVWMSTSSRPIDITFMAKVNRVPSVSMICSFSYLHRQH